MIIENPFKDADDKLLFAKVLDRLTAWQKKKTPTFTDFLNPVQNAAFMQHLLKHGAKSFGGYSGAEREMIGYGAEEPLTESFPIMPIAVTYNEKFSKAPTHRDYLGSVLGLGIDRGKIGDIRIAEAGAVMYAAEDIAAYIAENLQQVGRVKVKLKLGETLPGLENTGTEKRITVASLRLDAVLSAALNLSRSKVSALIDSEKVFINWKPAKKTQILHPGDNLTVRGIGRIIINEDEGRTKKDRIVLTITKS